MLGFENFDIRFWGEGGVTTHVPACAQTRSRQKRSGGKSTFKSVVLGAAAALVVLTNSSLVCAQPTLTVMSWKTSEKFVNDNDQSAKDGDVPDGYWMGLISLLKNAPALSTDDHSPDPDPIV